MTAILRDQLKAFKFSQAFQDRNWNPPTRQPFIRNIHDREITCTTIAEQGGWSVLEITANDIDITAPCERGWREMVDKSITDQIHQHILITG
ncbi:MAG: hypothetical protein WCO98_09725 [bacterium]